MKLGIAGNGGIVTEALKALRDTDIEVNALWCRNEERGKPLVQEYEISALYTDYDAFLKDESFDTVYIGLINSLHYSYAEKALRAHKHVIVEKPFTAAYNQAVDLVNTAVENDVYVFEAVMSRYAKNYELVMEHLDDIGELKLITANYSQYSRRYDEYLKGNVLPAFDPKLCGGALMDINVYNIHFVTGMFGAPQTAFYMANKGFNGIDTSGVLSMDYGSFKAVCIGAKDSAVSSGIILQGTEGYIRIDNRPGIVRNITVHRNNGEVYRLDQEEEENPLTSEFLCIEDAIRDKAEGRIYNWMNHSIQTMLVIQNARQDADIVFPEDES